MLGLKLKHVSKRDPRPQCVNLPTITWCLWSSEQRIVMSKHLRISQDWPSLANNLMQKKPCISLLKNHIFVASTELLGHFITQKIFPQRIVALIKPWFLTQNVVHYCINETLTVYRLIIKTYATRHQNKFLKYQFIPYFYIHINLASYAGCFWYLVAWIDTACNHRQVPYTFFEKTVIYKYLVKYRMCHDLFDTIVSWRSRCDCTESPGGFGCQ